MAEQKGDRRERFKNPNPPPKGERAKPREKAAAPAKKAAKKTVKGKD